jgi:hypothetical protein
MASQSGSSGPARPTKWMRSPVSASTSPRTERWIMVSTPPWEPME